VANARTSVDGGDEGQKGEYGTLFEAGVGLERLGHLRKRLDVALFLAIVDHFGQIGLDGEERENGGIGDGRINHSPQYSVVWRFGVLASALSCSFWHSNKASGTISSHCRASIALEF